MSNADTSSSDQAQVADDYTAIWSEPDVDRRRAAIAGLWTGDGIEFVEGAQFRGHDELHARVAHAYAEFVGSGPSNR
jgi:hypothetical protein